MFKINLVPEVQEQKQQIAKINSITTTVALILLGATVIVLIILGGIAITNKTMATNAEKEVKNTEEELKEYKDLEDTLISLEKGLAGTRQILDGNNTWTKLLPHLENATPKDVKYKVLSLSGNAITATIEGRDINSLARFAESFKDYQLYSLAGNGAVGSKIAVIIDGTSYEALVKTNGQWVFPITFSPNADHTIVIKEGDTQVAEIKYDSKTSSLTADTAAVSLQKKRLFSNVEISQYQKNAGILTFEAKMNFDGAIIW